MKQKLFFLLFLFFVFFLYISTKPFFSEFYAPSMNELEYIELDKSQKQTKSTFIVYQKGILQLRFKVTGRENDTATVYITLNNKKLDPFKIDTKKEKLKQFFVSRGDYFFIDIDKASLDSSDEVSLNLKFQSQNDLFLNILILVFWLGVAFFAWKYQFLYGYFVAYGSFLIIVYAEQIAYGGITINSLFGYSSLFFLILLIHFKIESLSKRQYRSIGKGFLFLFYFFLLLPATMAIIYCVSLHTTLEPSALDALFATNLSEAKAYINDFIDTSLVGSFVLVILLLAYMLYKQNQLVYKEKNWLNKFFFLLVAFSIYLYSANLPLFNTLLAKYQLYNHEALKFQKLQASRQVSLQGLDVKKKEKGEVYILVIGESLNKHHMHMYGYFRDDTPLMQTQQIFQFKNAYSNSVYTTAVLSYALTQANFLNKKDYLSSYSIVEIAKKAGFKTYWLTNQVLQGGWDNVISVIAHQSDKLVGLNHGVGKTVHTEHYDEDLLPYLDSFLQKNGSENKFIVIHLMGNHNSYKDRYPKTFNKYQGHLNYHIFGSLAKKPKMDQLINSYDNSVLYNDMIVHKIMQSVEKLPMAASVLYLSDHSEDVDNNFAHNPSKFTYAMCEIPMFIYVNAKYKEKYTKKISILKSHTDALFNNANLYDTLIGMMGIETSKMEQSKNLFSGSYELLPSQAFTLHGKKLYTAKENRYFHFQNNAKNLQKKGIGFGIKDVFPLKDITEFTYNGMNNLIVHLKLNKNRVMVVYKEVQVPLEELLQFLQTRQIQIELNFIVDDVKLIKYLQKYLQNYSQNYKMILSLSTLKEYHFTDLDDKCILQFENEHIYDAILNLNNQKLESFAKEYQQIIQKYNITHFMFDNKIKSFVQSYFKKRYSYYIVVDKSLSQMNALKSLELETLKKKNVVLVFKYCTLNEKMIK